MLFFYKSPFTFTHLSMKGKNYFKKSTDLILHHRSSMIFYIQEYIKHQNSMYFFIHLTWFAEKVKHKVLINILFPCDFFWTGCRAYGSFRTPAEFMASSHNLFLVKNCWVPEYLIFQGLSAYYVEALQMMFWSPVIFVTSAIIRMKTHM